LKFLQVNWFRLIGSNGAGKTTTMKAITGLLSASAGSIELNAKPIHQCKPWDLVKQGLAMVPEGRGVFTRMTIVENLQMGAYSRNDGADIDEDMERIFTTFPRLTRTQQPNGRHFVWRRAANVSDGTCVDESP
jgi:branched-chain amino acid transport system ATP-binding protein